MNRKELVKRIKSISAYKKSDIENIMTLLLAVISDALAEGEQVELRGFGTFGVKTKRRREARNPRTGEVVEVAEQQMPTWKPSALLKERINNNVTHTS